MTVLRGDAPGTARRVGVLLVNLGTPDAPDAASVRRYLNEFLSDRRVVELPPLLWQPILKCFVLTARPARTAANYARIWDRETNESPLARISREQAQAVAAALGPDIEVAYAMRYGNPPIEAALRALEGKGCDRICIAPLYPQYSGATTGSVLDEVFRCLRGRRHMPAIRSVAPYFDHPAHIDALRESLSLHLGGLGFEPERMILSFHGMPRRTTERGDPYHAQCLATARLLREASGMDEQHMPVAFQSQFGKGAWLQPYLLPMVERLAADGVRRIAVMAPGFAADCIETLEEIDMQVRDAFMAAGGTHFAAIPCLNSTEQGTRMLHRILADALAGWD